MKKPESLSTGTFGELMRAMDRAAKSGSQQDRREALADMTENMRRDRQAYFNQQNTR